MMVRCSLLRSLYHLDFIFNVAEGLGAIRSGRVQINHRVEKDPAAEVHAGDVVTFLKHSRTVADLRPQFMTEMLQLDGIIPTLRALQEALTHSISQSIPLYRELTVPYLDAVHSGATEVSEREVEVLRDLLSELQGVNDFSRLEVRVSGGNLAPAKYDDDDRGKLQQEHPASYPSP